MNHQRSIGLLLISLLVLLVPQGVTQEVLTAGEVGPQYQDYDFSPSKRCRLLAHQSVVLKNEKHHLLVVDSGFGIFRTRVNGTEVRVLDLNPYTVAFDLNKDFPTPGLDYLWQYKKPSGSNTPPITNHGGLWYSDDQNQIYYQGGHFYDGSEWNSSLYHVSKWQIPPWQLWQMDVSSPTHGWKDITPSLQGHEYANMTFAGAAASVPGAKKGFWIGGLIDATTAATTPNNTLATTDQMLIYDYSNNSISRTKYHYPQSTAGYYQGDLVHLPIGPNDGYLISLMSLQQPVGGSWLDTDGADGNQEVGDPVTWETIPLYDVETGTWFEQQTSYLNNEIPQPRTRFCTAMFYDDVDNTYNLWVHGGQLLSDQTKGVSDIYVLSMPSFVWSKVETPNLESNLVRSHTCHAVGGQLVIVGGNIPGLSEPINATCDSEYVKVLGISEKGTSWPGAYTTQSKYRNPKSIQFFSSQRSPRYPFAYQKLENDFNYKAPTLIVNPEAKPPEEKKGSNKRAIAAGLGAGVAVLVILLVFLVLRHLQRKKQAKLASAKEAACPPSPQNGQPEVVSRDLHDANDHRQAATTTVSEIMPYVRRATFELESPQDNRPQIRGF